MPESESLTEIADFRRFLYYIWIHLGLPKPTATQLEIARWMQHGPDREIIQAFRGVGKSWIAAAFVCFVLLHDPQKKILVVSASQVLADNFSIFVKQLIDSVPILQHLAPNPWQRTSNLMFDVGPAEPDPAPSVKSAGITGQITGSRADIIIPDDIEVPKNSFTHALRERIAELVKEFDAVLKPGGRVVYLGTPQTEASLYRRLEKRGYITRIWPSEMPQNVERYHGRLAPSVVAKFEAGVAPGTPLEPDRFSLEDLAQRKLSYGSAGYYLQFMLDTTISDMDRHPLRCRDLIVWDCDNAMAPLKMAWCNDRLKVWDDLECGGIEGDAYYQPAYHSPEMAEYTGTVMYIDPSGSGKDETAYAIVRFLSGTLYLVDVGGYRDGFGEATLKALAGKALRHKVGTILCEPNYGGGMFTKLLEPVVRKIHSCTIEDAEWSSSQKELRICDTLEPILRSHRLVVDRRVVQDDLPVQAEHPHYSFIQQLSRITRDRGSLPNEDRLESVAGACAHWIKLLSLDAHEELKNHRNELLQQELDKFVASALGHSSPKSYNWTDTK